MIRRLLRALRCWRHACPGRVVTEWEGSILYIGWRCSDCGEVKHWQPSRVRRP